MKKEYCQNCCTYNLQSFIDPQIGGYVRCAKCHWILTEAEVTDENID